MRVKVVAVFYLECEDCTYRDRLDNEQEAIEKAEEHINSVNLSHTVKITEGKVIRADW